MAHAAQHQAPAAAPNEWERTSEGLPPEGERVLAATYHGVVEVARREGDRWFTRGANHCRGTLQGVAYWARLQPLPPEILRRIQRAAAQKEKQP